MTACPSEAILRLVGTEAVGETTFAILEAHVEQCPDCQKLLESGPNAVPRAKNPASVWASPTLPGLVFERQLGSGSSSVVYLAWEPALQRHVAVKLIPKNAMVEQQARQRWLVEARALSKVPHDHVVAIHRVEESEAWLCLILEYVPGGTLKDRSTEPLAPRDAARLTETIARAVNYFHAKGLRHLDLKPANILLGGEPGAPWEQTSPKISDFGIARLEGEPGTTLTGANGPKGTPSYMAPEQVAALPGTIGPAADVYALGAILYRLLTGRPPLQGASLAETLEQVRNQEPAPPRRINGRIPRDLETICLRCLEKAPTRRYRSAEALADDLKLWLDGRPIRARRISPIGHAWRFCRRRPAVAGLLGALAITLTSGVVGLVVLLNQAEAERTRIAEVRRHAEAYERFSASTADQVAKLLGTSLRQMRSSTPDEMRAILKNLSESSAKLRKEGAVASSTLGVLESEIAWGLKSFNRPKEARDLYYQAIDDLKQSMAQCPENEEIRFQLGIAFLTSGELAEEAGEVEDALRRYEASAAALTVGEENIFKYFYINSIYRRLHIMIDRLERGGPAEQERRARQSCRQILGYFFGSDLTDSADGSAPAPAALGRLFQGKALQRMAAHEDKSIRINHERFVAEWLAFSVESLSPFHSSSAAAEFDRNPETGAVALLSVVQDRCSRLGLQPQMVPATFAVMKEEATVTRASQRKQGRFGEARATAARLMTIARLLVRNHPDNAHSFRILSEAHALNKKNAFDVDDRKSALESLVRAVEAGQRAVALDPDRLEMQHHLEQVTRQLDTMRAERAAEGSASPTSPSQ